MLQVVRQYKWLHVGQAQVIASRAVNRCVAVRRRSSSIAQDRANVHYATDGSIKHERKYLCVFRKQLAVTMRALGLGPQRLEFIKAVLAYQFLYLQCW